jgi:diaminopimelate decarboxylase
MRQAVKRALLRVVDRMDKRGVTRWTLPPDAWGLAVGEGGRLAWDGVDLQGLAERFGTPLHVVNRAHLERDYRAFHDAFAAHFPRVDVGYSYKTNPLPGVLEALHAAGATAEVISHFELWLALRLGVPPDRVIFNGPGKTREGLELALRAGVKLVNLDGLTELELAESVAAAVGRRQRVGVRVVASVGWSGQFGVRIADGAALAAFTRLRRSPHLDPRALHVHLGSGIQDTGVYLRAAEEALAFVQRLRTELGIAIEHLDLGGGFGVPTVRSYTTRDFQLLLNGFRLRPPVPDKAPRPADFAAAIVPLVARYCGADRGAWPEIILEPGRAVTSSAQLLLLRVIALKDGDAIGPYAILDGGRNLTMPTGYEYHEVLPVAADATRPRRAWSLFGPLCHPGDLLFKGRQLPDLAIGDAVAVMDAGAYFIPNQMNFSNPRPAAVMIDGGETRVIRARESFEDIVRLDGMGAPEDGMLRSPRRRVA